MKVIIIKECKDWKVNEIINVSVGYATNFLIKKGFALPLNVKTQKKLKDNIKKKEELIQSKFNSVLKAKEFIEKLLFTFSLNITPDMKVHGSITRKQIIKKLKEKGVHINNYAVENIKIDTIGISIVKIFLAKDVVAKLKIEVKNNG